MGSFLSGTLFKSFSSKYITTQFWNTGSVCTHGVCVGGGGWWRLVSDTTSRQTFWMTSAETPCWWIERKIFNVDFYLPLYLPLCADSMLYVEKYIVEKNLRTLLLLPEWHWLIVTPAFFCDKFSHFAVTKNVKNEQVFLKVKVCSFHTQWIPPDLIERFLLYCGYISVYTLNQIIIFTKNNFFVNVFLKL
jgi:hypothetical protein